MRVIHKNSVGISSSSKVKPVNSEAERQQSKSIRQNLIILNFAKTFFDKISLNTIASSLSTNVYHVSMDRL